jgi:K+-sensing histidine kinase KdpD
MLQFQRSGKTMYRALVGHTEQSRWGYYLIATLASVLALASTMNIWPLPTTMQGEAPPFAISVPVVLFCAWFLGRGPGLLATFLVVAGHAWFFYPSDSLVVARYTDLVHLFLYAMLLTLFSLVSGDRRRAHDDMALLSRAGAVLASTLDQQAILENSVSLALPALGDFSVIYLAGVDGMIERVVAMHADRGKLELARQFSFQLPDLERDPALAGVIRLGQPAVENRINARYCEKTDSGRVEDRLTLELGIRARVIVPLIAHGPILGAFGVHRISRRAFHPNEVALIEELGRRIAVAVENARLFRETERRYETSRLGRF